MKIIEFLKKKTNTYCKKSLFILDLNFLKDFFIKVHKHKNESNENVYLNLSLSRWVLVLGNKIWWSLNYFKISNSSISIIIALCLWWIWYFRIGQKCRACNADVLNIVLWSMFAHIVLSRNQYNSTKIHNNKILLTNFEIIQVKTLSCFVSTIKNHPRFCKTFAFWQNSVPSTAWASLTCFILLILFASSFNIVLFIIRSLM